MQNTNNKEDFILKPYSLRWYFIRFYIFAFLQIAAAFIMVMPMAVLDVGNLIFILALSPVIIGLYMYVANPKRQLIRFRIVAIGITILFILYYIPLILIGFLLKAAVKDFIVIGGFFLVSIIAILTSIYIIKRVWK